LPNLCHHSEDLMIQPRITRIMICAIRADSCYSWLMYQKNRIFWKNPVFAKVMPSLRRFNDTATNYTNYDLCNSCRFVLFVANVSKKPDFLEKSGFLPNLCLKIYGRLLNNGCSFRAGSHRTCSGTLVSV